MKIIKISGAVLALGMAVLFGMSACSTLPTITQADKDALRQQAGAYDVEIVRDPYGVPYIFGKRDADVAFGLGYANAEDDFSTIQETVWAVRGNLARRNGMDAAITDYLVHLMRVWDSVDKQLAAGQASDEARALAQAYAAALNLYALRHPDEVWEGSLPFTERDIFAGILFKQPMFFRIDTVLTRLFEGPASEEKQARNASPLFLASDRTGLPVGSNAMAVAPKRSTDGHTRLFVNSHQPFEGPVAWYEARLKSEEGLDIMGGTFPGFPLIGHGVTPTMGWAFTVNIPDLVDVYELTINPDNEDEYLLDGEWVAFEKSEAPITVKLLGPIRWTVKREVLWSKHGPALRTDHGVYAVRYPGMDDLRPLDQYLKMNKSRSLAQWRDAMRTGSLHSFNAVVADSTGRVGYFHNSRMPKRTQGPDWTQNLPGDDSSLIWTEEYGFDDVPQVVDPQSGYVFNSNNTPFVATDGPDNARIEDMPVTQAFEMQMTNRGYRQLETYGADPAISRDEFIAYKFDLKYSKQSDFAKQVQVILDAEFDDPLLQKAQAQLATWDMGTERSNRGTALPILAFREIIKAEIQKKPWPDVMDGFKWAAHYLQDNYGRLDPEWGELNRIIRGDTNMALDGGPDILRAVYDPEGPHANKQLKAVAGDTLVMLADWDKQGQLDLVTVHQFGSASQRPESPHYDDQVPLFAAMKFKPTYLPLDAAELKELATRAYKPAISE